jgi:phenylacetate 2-hydroxylase
MSSPPPPHFIDHVRPILFESRKRGEKTSLAKVTIAEIKSLCLTMVSAGLDTVPGNLVMAAAFLASPEGWHVQRKAFDEIMKVYPNGDAWEKCLVEEKVAYVTAFVRETLRFWTVIPICLPRKSVKSIEYNGAIIPAGTTFFMVRFTL